MKRKLIAALALSAAMCATGLNAWADEPWVSQLDEIVVTADRNESAKKEVTSNISIIDAQTIQNSAANDLGELLAELGFQTRNYPGANTSLGIRGYRSDTHGSDLSSRVLMLLNGRRIGSGNAAVFALANIERIEIIRGPAASQYGAAAMGGVVNVITKKGTGDGSYFSARAEAGLGSYNSHKALVNLAAQMEGFDVAFGYRYYDRDDYSTADGDRYKNTAVKASNAFNLDTGYTFLDNHRLGVTVNYFDTMSSAPGSITSASYNKIHKTNYNVAFNYTGGTSGEMFTWAANYAFGEDERNYRDHNAMGFTGRSKYTVDTQTAQVRASFNQKHFTLTAGFDFADYDLDDDSSKAEYKNYAGFILGKLRLFDEKLIISAGGRYDDFSVKGKTQGMNIDEDRFSPSAGVAFTPFSWLKLRAHYAQGFIMPSPSYIFGDDKWYIPNLNLKPEKNETYEAGFDIGWNYLDFSFTYFYSIGKDALNGKYLGSDPYFYTYQYENLDKSVREGLEAEFSGDVAKALGFNAVEVRPYVNLTYMTTYKGRGAKHDPYTKLNFVPKYNIGYGVRFSYPEYNFTTTLSAAYFGKEHRSATVQNESYTVVNWTARKQLFELSDYGHVDIKAEVNNLFNEDYAYVSGYPMPGRNFYVGLAYAF